MATPTKRWVIASSQGLDRAMEIKITSFCGDIPTATRLAVGASNSAKCIWVHADTREDSKLALEALREKFPEITWTQGDRHQDVSE